MLKCTACNGVFSPVGADGVRYFHVCPPERVYLVYRDGKRRRVTGGEMEPTDLMDVIRSERTQRVRAIDVQETDIPLDVGFRRRANARNENTLRYEGDTRVIVAEGLGVVEVLDAPLSEE